MRKLRNEELGRKSIEEFKNAQKLSIVVVLDNVRSALNVGSVFRTSDAFLIESVFLCGITACPPNPDIHKTALGGENTVSWNYFKTTLQAIEELKQNGFNIFAVEQTEGSISLPNFSIDKTQKYALIFGHEVDGVDQEVILKCDGSIEIPQWGSKHSLNISVSTGIVLWEIANKWRQ
jgi:tRNA G18 (ribose-2'-O)-methylase SpoU